MRFRIVLAALVGAFSITDILAMDGKAVTSIAYRSNSVTPPNTFKLVVSTIRKNAVVRQDTLLRSNTIILYPTFSFDGKHIAFLRNGAGLSIVDPDGQNLRVITTAGNYGEGIGDKSAFIAWPGADGGNQIYYSVGNAIWKVNVNDPTQKSQVCTYGSGFFRRWALSTDAKYAVSHIDGRGINVHSFPSLGGSPGGAGIGGECNSAMSTSGTLVYHFSGTHTSLYAKLWNHAANTLGSFSIGTGPAGACWMYRDVQPFLNAGPGLGNCLVYPRGSSNSDQIFTVLSTYPYCAGYDCGGGGNQVIVNWKDHESVMPSNNPSVAYPSGELFWYCEPGDFWLDGAPANGYEDTAGNWISVVDGRKLDVSLGPSVDTLRFSADAGGANPATQSVTLTAGPDVPANPQLTVSGDAAWITASAQGLQVQNRVDIAGLPSGIYRATVAVGGSGVGLCSYCVVLRLNATAQASTISVSPAAALVAPGQTRQFSAAVFDQFETPFPATVAWSVSGGGAISPSGLFASDGTIGNFVVRASAGEVRDSAIATVSATSTCGLPTGFFTELLCLIDPTGSQYLNSTTDILPRDDSTITGTYSSTPPTEGTRITLEGKTYTWQLRKDADGAWVDSQRDNFYDYYSIIISAQAPQRVRISSRYDDQMWAWCNGKPVGHLCDGGTLLYFYNNGENQTNTFTLNAGENNLFLKHYQWGAENHFSARIVDTLGNNVSGLRYFPCTNSAISVEPAGMPTCPPRSRHHATILAAALRIAVDNPGAHAVSVMDSRGRRIAAMRGTGAATYEIDRKTLTPGMYLVNVTTGATTETTRIAVQ